MAEELTPLNAIEEPTWRALARFFVHVCRSTLPCFASAVIAIAESLG